MPRTHSPALLLGAWWEAPLLGVPQHADRIGEEPCEFQELPHHHQTSRAAPWLWGPAPPPERAKQVLPWRGPECQHW